MKQAFATRRTVGWTDRVVQFSLLLLIAWGIYAAVGIASGSTGATGGASGATGTQGGPPSAPGPGVVSAEAPGAARAASTTPVAVTTATRGRIAEIVRLNGDVVASRSVTVYPDVAGKIVSWNVSEGDTVVIGDTLGVVDPSVPGERYTTSPIRSTIAGTVVSYEVDAGDTVSQATAVATVADLSQLDVEVAVPERYVATIHRGLAATIEVAAFPDSAVRGRVVVVSPVLDPDTRTLAVTLAVSDPAGRVRPGMFAAVQLETMVAEDVVVVPITALADYYDSTVVYIVTDDGHAERREVSVGLASDDVVEITAGVSAGDRVVIAGLSTLADGDAVNVVDDGGDA